MLKARVRGPERRSYGAIMIDPPWPLRGGTALSKAYGPGKRGADRHYPVVPIKKIPPLILESGVWRPSRNCHLYLWAINNYLPQALWVMEQLDFRYVTMVTWVKEGARPGQGRYFRGKTEHMLFGVRGQGLKNCTKHKNLPTKIHAPVQGHSVKPQVAYDLVRSRSRGSKLEMFSRKPREGWTAWGHI